MRIIRGTLKGRHITLPKNLNLRPTTDFAKEGLFNVLDNILDYETLTALDLFSGTGAISYELYSRGAHEIYSIEQNPAHYDFIKKTCDQLEMESIRVYKSDVFRYVRQCPQQFDFIFADPPYDLENLEHIPDIIFEQSLLNDSGIFILEHPKRFNFKDHPNFKNERKYGNVHFSFFENKF